jgi:catechol 2,3-dioxygenase-like lactoylglutathione lyase family enzyme
MQHHHVNLNVSPENVDAQEAFLTDVLGYRRMELDDYLRGVGARWFEGTDGSQIHLSAQPHVAVEFGSDLSALEDRLRDAGVEFTSGEFMGIRVTRCTDPAGNEWELRGK